LDEGERVTAVIATRLYRKRRTRITYAITMAVLLGFLVGTANPVRAQNVGGPAAAITGRVTDASTHNAIVGAAVTIEGTTIGARTDSTGEFRIAAAPAGPQVLRAQRIGYSPTRISLAVPTSGALTRDIAMARHALELSGIRVTADPNSRARGELGTATVIEQEAIRNQTASSLAGILELVPGVVVQAPGLDNVQQISLRSVPISSGAPGSTDRSAENLAAFGTLIVLDGVPLSNNANLQRPGGRSELTFSSSAGGGIDLRRIPASTIERVEVIRGVPSARYGDLTNGAIIVDTRAGAVPPEFALRFDARTSEASIVGGTRLGQHQSTTLSAGFARTRTPSGTRNDEATRFTAQLAHRALFGRGDLSILSPELAQNARLVMDTRADFFQLVDNHPEIETLPGQESRTRDASGRLSERMRLRLGSRSRIELTGALELGQQRALSRQNLTRGATPVTNRTTAGRSVGRYLGGVYNARAHVDGDPSLFYLRPELIGVRNFLGISHELRFGGELRREANKGNGYQFDIEFPPETSFNGVQGFARPRSFSVVPPLATSAAYLDDRISRVLPGDMLLNVQLGVRADVLHQGRTWFSGARDASFQPRLNLELAPKPWLRLRAGAGRVAKLPSLDDLYPALEYFDVINVNFFANAPAERLAVLTTSIFDPTNPKLGYSIADKAEAGFEMRLGTNADLGFVAFKDRIKGAVGITREPTFILREHFGLTNTVPGSGTPPVLVEPAAFVDSVPIVIDRPTNNTNQTGSGYELTATLPEIPALRTRFAFQGALVKSRLERGGIDFATSFPTFQISENQKIGPYYNGLIRTGERLLLTTRIIHHQPSAGLILTGTIQHTLRDIQQNIGGTDTLAFVGYITRGGSLVPVPSADKGLPQYIDIRIPRRGVLAEPQKGAVDWVFSFQVSKTLPLDGRLSFYAFNAFDRVGHFGSLTTRPQFYQSNRFGVEVTMPVEGLFAWR